MFKCETAKLHRFCLFSHKLHTKRNFLEESLDIISLMWYNIIHKSVKLLGKGTSPQSRTLLQDISQSGRDAGGGKPPNSHRTPKNS